MLFAVGFVPAYVRCLLLHNRRRVWLSSQISGRASENPAMRLPPVPRRESSRLSDQAQLSPLRRRTLQCQNRGRHRNDPGGGGRGHAVNDSVAAEIRIYPQLSCCAGRC